MSDAAVADGSHADSEPVDAMIDAPMASPEPVDPTSSVPCTGRLGFPAQSLLAVSSTGFGYTQLRVVDVDGDGQLDLVTNGANEAGVFHGVGNGTFGAALGSPMMQGLAQIADVVGDSTPDVLVSVTQAGVNSLAIYMGSAAGTFATAPLSVATANVRARQIEVADLNNDGKPDIVLHDTGGLKVAVVLATAAGFAPAVLYDVASSQFASRMVLADLGGDARIDIAVLDSSQSTVNVIVNQGDGTFAARTAYATGFFPKNLLAADVNDDGKTDLLVVRPSTVANTQIDTLTRSGTGFSAPISSVLGSTGMEVLRFVAADVDADGHVDVAVMLEHELTVARGTGTGQFTAPTTINVRYPRDLALADVDGVRGPDLIVFDGNTITPYLNTGTATPFELAVSMDVGPYGNRAGRVLDLDGNARLDLVAVGSSGMSINLGTSTGFGPPSSTFLPDVNPSFTLAFDADNDSRLDVFIAGDYAIQTLHNDGTGALPAQPVTRVAPITDDTLWTWKTADLNGDGFRDAVRGAPDGITFYPGVNGTFSSTPILVRSGGYQGFVTIDIDEDGDVDVVVNTGSTQEVILNQGGGVFDAPIVTTSPQYRWLRAVRDFNEDGHPDILSTKLVGYEVLLGNGTSAPTTAVDSPGPVGGNLVFADFDGDGHLDFATLGDQLRVSRGRGDGSFLPPLIYGVLGNTLDAGDIDADGRVDLFLYVRDFNEYQILYGRCL